MYTIEVKLVGSSELSGPDLIFQDCLNQLRASKTVTCEYNDPGAVQGLLTLHLDADKASEFSIAKLSKIYAAANWLWDNSAKNFIADALILRLMDVLSRPRLSPGLVQRLQAIYEPCLEDFSAYRRLRPITALLRDDFDARNVDSPSARQRVEAIRNLYLLHRQSWEEQLDKALTTHAAAGGRTCLFHDHSEVEEEEGVCFLDMHDRTLMGLPQALVAAPDGGTVTGMSFGPHEMGDFDLEWLEVEGDVAVDLWRGPVHHEAGQEEDEGLA